MEKYNFIYHNYVGDVLSLDRSGTMILFNNYQFNIYNLSSNNINLYRNIKESLNLKIELKFEDISENIVDNLYCQFICQKLTNDIDLSNNTIREIIIESPSKHCIFPLKRKGEYFNAIIDKENIDLALNNSGEYICYFILVMPQQYQEKKDILPKFKYILNKNLQKIITNKIIITIHNKKI